MSYSFEISRDWWKSPVELTWRILTEHLQFVVCEVGFPLTIRWFGNLICIFRAVSCRIGKKGWVGFRFRLKEAFPLHLLGFVVAV